MHSAQILYKTDPQMTFPYQLTKLVQREGWWVFLGTSLPYISETPLSPEEIEFNYKSNTGKPRQC